MTTRLEAINDMLACVGQAPLESLDGTKSYFTIAAENILDSEIKRVQLIGWDFNTEDCYQLLPNQAGQIPIAEDMLNVKIPRIYRNRYVIRYNKIYDKLNHTFNIDKPIKASVVFCLKFEDLPEAVRTYIKMSAAYKFCKKELGSEKTCQYTQEDLAEALIIMQEYELSTGNYNILNEYFTGEVRGRL